MVVAHRACWKQAPENSLAAIDDCHALGVDMIELDVRRTRDGHLVLMHDGTVDRTTDGVGQVSELSLAQLRRLRLREGAGGPSAPVVDAHPPTFTEAMRAARDAGLLVNVDAKSDVLEQALDELETLGLLDHALIKSAAPTDDPALHDMLAGRELLFMPIVREADAIGLVEATTGWTMPDGMPPLAFEYTFQTEQAFIDAAKIAGARDARVWVNTLQPHHAAGHVDALALVDPDAHWGHLIRSGANMIQTDEPEALMAYLRTCGCTGY